MWIAMARQEDYFLSAKLTYSAGRRGRAIGGLELLLLNNFYRCYLSKSRASDNCGCFPETLVIYMATAWTIKAIYAMQREYMLVLNCKNISLTNF
jgi:hypothetical protein